MDKVIKTVIPEKYLDERTVYHINPCGQFVLGGPQVSSLAFVIICWLTHYYVFRPSNTGAIVAMKLAGVGHRISFNDDCFFVVPTGKIEKFLCIFCAPPHPPPPTPTLKRPL